MTFGLTIAQLNKLKPNAPEPLPMPAFQERKAA